MEKVLADKAVADKAAAEKTAAIKAAIDGTPNQTLNNAVALSNGAVYSNSAAALTMLFVVAVLLENAFSVIFNWTVFLAYNSLPGVKTIIMIVASWIVVGMFHIDVMASLIAACQSTKDRAVPPISGAPSQFITALILAGGSAGVNRIMVALGFRSLRTQEDVVPRPPQNRAWVAVLLKWSQAVGDVFVQIEEIGPAAGVANAPLLPASSGTNVRNSSDCCFARKIASRRTEATQSRRAQSIASLLVESTTRIIN